MLEHTDAIDPRPLLGSFQSDLFLPRYRHVAHGPWTISPVAMVAARGYWGDVYRISGALIMSGPSEAGTQSWMSMLPMELESQEIGLRASRGHTVVCGLGMGWLLANVALRDEVEHVSVLERDEHVIALIHASGVLEQLPAEARRKITVHHTDATQWRPDSPVDTLQADIWRLLLEDGKLDSVRRMNDNIAAAEVYFWGQEMEIWRYACRRVDALAQGLDWPLVRAIVAEDLQLPIILPDGERYPQQIVSAAPWWTPATAGWWR